MQQELKKLIAKTLHILHEQHLLETDIAAEDIQIERTRDSKFGDFACNLALILAKPAKKNPRELAELIVQHLPASELVTKVEIAGPGFINFTLADSAYLAILPLILKQGPRFGQSTLGQQKKVHLEFVSANPTGPLHVGHGRGAAFGACLGNVLEMAGYQVHREYYVNDAGRQMRILALSVWLRYLEKLGEKVTFPGNGYRGDYILAIADKVHEAFNSDLKHQESDIRPLLQGDP
jgi:arginyl-tRNA synthetase